MKISNSHKQSGDTPRVRSARNHQVIALAVAAIVLLGGIFGLSRGHAASGVDLIVTGVTITPAAPTAGQNVSFSATLKNQGTGATDAGSVVGVAFAVDGNRVAWNESSTTSLAAGASVTLTANAGANGSITWLAAPGPHTITATADHGNVVPNELNETNNTKDLSSTVSNNGKLYLSPATTAILPNTTGEISIRSTPNVSIDGAEIVVTYDPAKLEFVSTDTTGAPLDIALGSQTVSGGKVTFYRGTLTSGGVAADNLIAKIKFKALATTGTSTIQLAGNTTHSGVYTNPTIQNSTTVNFTVPDAVAPVATITAPAAGTIFVANKTITATATDAVGVTKVEFYIDGQLKSTDTSSPYSYVLNTTTLTNGNHTLLVKASDAAGNVGTSASRTITVKNLDEDIDQDGDVDLADFSAISGNFLRTGTNLGRVDVDHDGDVDLIDFSRVSSKFGA